ncbi:MAG: NAD(P)H-dependent oxidoreductase [Cytophagales bacterium]|nr:NAD(P)H-dependent oxidoreductase [Cytophagales bacterium]
MATPVYWYSMSGIMKVFLDRIYDVLTIEKELGRKLHGKKWQ